MNLEELAPSHAEAFLSFVDDLRANDRASFDLWFDREWNAKTFAAYAKECASARLDWRPKAKQISTTTYLLVDEAGVAGFGLLRFPLTPEIEKTGGNFVFVVAPKRRRQGLGPVVLNRLLFEGARAGLARAFVSCGVGDAAARRSIEDNRGVSAGVVGHRETFWIPLR